MNWQLIVNIIITSSLYLLIAIGFYVIYSVTKFFHVAHAIIISIGAYFVYLFHNIFHFEFYFSIPCALFFSIIIGLLCEVLVYSRMRKKNMPQFTYLVASIGIYTVLLNIISMYFGDDTKTFNIGESLLGHQILGAYITSIQIALILISVFVFIGIHLLMKFTIFGKQMRAVSENIDLASIYGISSKKVIIICFAIGSTLGAVVGILSSFDTNLTPAKGFNLLLYGIVAMIIGGIGSIRGLVWGSLLVAIAQNMVAYYVDAKWMDSIAYLLLIFFLLWKPLGFSGKRLKKIEI